MVWVVFPRYICIVVAALNWSVFDCFRVICIDVEDVQLSKATSDNNRSADKLKEPGDDVVN